MGVITKYTLLFSYMLLSLLNYSAIGRFWGNWEQLLPPHYSVTGLAPSVGNTVSLFYEF